MRVGGEMGMIQLASASMLDPDLNDQRPRPVSRIVGDRDIINNELGIFYNGYEAQTGKPVLTGPPTAEFQEMFDVALEGYKRIAATLRSGKTAPIPWLPASSSMIRAMMSTAAICKVCSVPTRATNPRSGPIDPRAPRTAISTTNRAGWYTKPEWCSPCKCTSSTSKKHVAYSSPTAVWLHSTVPSA